MKPFMDEPPPQPVKQEFVFMPIKRKNEYARITNLLAKFFVTLFYPLKSLTSLVILYVCDNITTDSVTAKITALTLLALYGNSAFWTTIFFAIS